MLNGLPEWAIAIAVLLILFLIIAISYQIYAFIVGESSIKMSKHKINIVDRLGSILPYGLPLLEGLQKFWPTNFTRLSF